MKNSEFKYLKILSFCCLTLLSGTAISFELLSEGAMGTVSAISANTAEEIVSVAGSTAAGLRVDDGYEVLPFKSSVQVDASSKDEVSSELDFSLVQEVEEWVDILRQRSEIATSSVIEVGYIDELPPSSFDESSFVIRDGEFDSIIFEPDNANFEDQESTRYEIGRIEQTFTKIEQKVDTVQYVVERKVDFVATIDSAVDGQRSIGSGYITNLTSISNVKIATVRD
tara:strand:+ start:5931 stop:6608 length:678 start_codon:yes stop_codon:yes gene_type:complete